MPFLILTILVPVTYIAFYLSADGIFPWFCGEGICPQEAIATNMTYASVAILLLWTLAVVYLAYRPETRENKRIVRRAVAIEVVAILQLAVVVLHRINPILNWCCALSHVVGVGVIITLLLAFRLNLLESEQEGEEDAEDGEDPDAQKGDWNY